MSNDRRNQIEADLQSASTVIYLEGKTDAPLMFALAGLSQPSSGIHKDVKVVGLKSTSGGSGGREVQALVAEATLAGCSGNPGAGGVFGIVDGDGEALSTLQTKFLPPYSGPLFYWPAYCIENLLAIVWPAGWGNRPNWRSVLESYIPYAALNRLHVTLRTALQTLGIERFHAPAFGQELKTIDLVKAALSADKGLIAGRDVEALFDAEVIRISAALSISLEEGHALVNGKWLVAHHARGQQPTETDDLLRAAWATELVRQGGHPAVRALWTHIVGTPP